MILSLFNLGFLCACMLAQWLKFKNCIFLLPVPGTKCSFDYLFHFHIFLKAFTLQGPLLDRSSLIHNLEFPLSKPKKLGALDCDKVYSLTMRCNVAHLPIIKTEVARFCKNFGHPWITISLRIYVYLLAHCHDNYFLSLLLRVYKCIGEKRVTLHTFFSEV